ncbi:MAG: hypothetical protein EOP15_00350 [Pseudomonas sp.]|nr:MAG: hypothetical protein EOP15_00350 [Pseudomonas sp.]
MPYNTMNPVGPNGSSDPRDLSDNAGGLDLALTSPNPSWPNRLGVNQPTWAGIVQRVNDYLAAQGFEPVPLQYVDGVQLVVQRPSQLIQRGIDMYSVKLPAAFPITLTGTWATDQAVLVAQVDRTLRAQLGDPIIGGGMIAWQRQEKTKYPGTILQILNGTEISVWEKRFVDLIQTKPDANNPSTWDWTPAFQAAANEVAQGQPGPAGGDYELLIPGGQRYPVTSVDIFMHTNVRSHGAIICPFDPAASKTHLLRFAGFNIVHGSLVIDMGYALNYQSAVWMRGRHSTFCGVVIFRARYAWMFGDIAWKTDPSKGALGDSENVLDHCATIWCMTAVRAYGQNTILHFNHCLLYSYKPRMGEEYPSDPRLSVWNSLPETTIINCGAIIYINGGGVCNFSGAAPLLQSELQPVAAADMKNGYGEFSIALAQLETGYLLKCMPAGSYAVENFTGIALTVSACRGHMSTTAGNFVDMGGDCMQAVNIDSTCRFYGNATNNIVYALGAPVYVSPKAFPGTSIDFFQALHARSPIGYDRFCAAYADSCNQTFAVALSDMRMPTLGRGDVWDAFAPEWYATGTGVLTPKSDMRNVEFSVSLSMTSGAASDSTTFVLLVNNAQVDIAVAYGAFPRACLIARRIPAGAVVKIQVSSSASRKASGEANNRLVVTGSV